MNIEKTIAYLKKRQKELMLENEYPTIEIVEWKGGESVNN